MRFMRFVQWEGYLSWQFQLYFGNKQGWFCPFILLGCVSLIQWNVCPLLGICSLQGVVTYTSPVEAFATGIKILDRRKSSLIAWSLRSEALDHLILREFKGQNVATPAKYVRKCVDRLILVAQNSSWSLDRFLKRTLIAWFHFDPGRKRFYRRRLSDYPLSLGMSMFNFSCPYLFGWFFMYQSWEYIIITSFYSHVTVNCHYCLHCNYCPYCLHCHCCLHCHYRPYAIDVTT